MDKPQLSFLLMWKSLFGFGTKLQDEDNTFPDQSYEQVHMVDYLSIKF